MLGLVPLRVWISLGAVAIAGLAVWSWGHLRYKQGVNDTVATYEKAAAVQREINAKATFRAVENTAVAVEKFTEIEVVRETRYVKDKAAVDAVWRYADRLRDDIARRGATPIEATSACATERGRLREAEVLVGEHGQLLASCAGLAVEGRDLAEKLSNKNDLWRAYVKALP